MSTEFRQLAVKGESGRAERLFRAAIAAYCALARPTRRDAIQLDDLALPLFASVPPQTKRFAAAALSECARTPPALVARLIDEPVDISAPLLVRSPAITDVELITLIGRHGLPHARAITRRQNLNPAIADLLDAFNDPEIRRLRGPGGRSALRVVPALSHEMPAEETAVENARRRLRAMMAPAGETRVAAPSAVGDGDLFGRLRETALSGHPPLFQTALADALGVDFGAARAITEQSGYRALLAAFCNLKLNEEQAYMLVATRFPAATSGAEAIRLFVYRYRLLVDAAARPLAHSGATGKSYPDGVVTAKKSSAA